MAQQRWKLDELKVWLSSQATPALPAPRQSYRHQLLKENLAQRPGILEELRALVWRAHEDARHHFRGPLSNILESNGILLPYDLAEGYPQNLPERALKGAFGELLAGLIAENFSPFGINDWVVPAFLFRFHSAAFDALERKRETGEMSAAIPGRGGNDCLAFQIDPDGHIKRSLICEAKCTSTHDSKLIAEAHAQLSDNGIRPISVWQLAHILQDEFDAGNTSVLAWMVELERLRLGQLDDSYERCDLVCYVYGQEPIRDSSWISIKTPHKNYTKNRRLEAVEIHLADIDALLQEVHTIKKEQVASPDSIRTIESEPDVINLALKLLQDRANDFHPRFAKLYSQHKLLREGQRGLTNWRPDEASDRLAEAVQLLQAAFIAQEVGGNEDWRKGMQRAGEILEWLAHPELNASHLPIRLLSAAVYQLAGYPARALGILKQTQTIDVESDILRTLLEADFPILLKYLTAYWATIISSEKPTITGSPWELENFEQWIVSETTQSLGIVCAEMRWGNELRVEQALQKLARVSKMMLHGQDVYSWLLSELCAKVASEYLRNSFRRHLPTLASDLNRFGEKAIENYLRIRYVKKKALAWSSQICGIERLKSRDSFALCTPTGSGKTTIAEVAILQSLFKKQIVTDETLLLPDVPAPLVLYLTPSRALAAEMESTLSRTLSNLGAREIVVTGLYGGTDWGPTDAWLNQYDPTVLICTYEKGEALMRFLGVWLRDRISLVIIDEAHSVDFDQGFHTLRRGENRTFRLEVLGTRLLAYLDKAQSRVIALSAVASSMENALACWISRQEEAKPENPPYRSTRQLIGRLECLPGSNFEIFYDLLDGADLQFENQREGRPFIPRPFPGYPAISSDWSGPQKALRPYLFWAGMNLAKQKDSEQQGAVLISITQGIGGYAEDFLRLLEKDWSEITPPNFFELPPAESAQDKLWQNCLKACEDYFTVESHEYRLLRRGIIVHHGQMPGSLARLLVEAIQERIIHLVLATSTLSDGVNLPFETVLIPSLRRNNKRLNPRELSNLIGRAGRPGFSAEGQSLVLMLSGENLQRGDYTIFSSLLQKKATQGSSHSPLAKLIAYIKQQWSTVSETTDTNEFVHWLETTAPLEFNAESENKIALIESLDTLDSFLLSSIVELEQMAQEDSTTDEMEEQLRQLATVIKSDQIGQQGLTTDELEERLRHIWQHSYAHYASQEEARLKELFVHRGCALQTHIYPDPTRRRKFYRTSLPPRDADGLLKLYPRVIEHLKTGTEYLKWNDSERFQYVKKTIELLATLPKFELEQTPKKITWQDILQWWFRVGFEKHIQFSLFGSNVVLQNKKKRKSLNSQLSFKLPLVKNISRWHKYVSRNFNYRFNWGLGSIIALAIDAAIGDLAPTLNDWSKTGLPWAAFWMKELIVWGTLEPVAAYLLARHLEVTRTEAENKAREYYVQKRDEYDLDEILNPKLIREWAETLPQPEDISRIPNPPSTFRIEQLLRDFSETDQKTWRVVPVETEKQVYWFDPAGFALAVSTKPERWLPEYLGTHDFVLDISRKEVVWELY